MNQTTRGFLEACPQPLPWTRINKNKMDDVQATIHTITLS